MQAKGWDGGVIKADKLILASASPRRQELLMLCGIPFECFAPDVDEHCVGEPATQVMALAKRKAEAAQKIFPNRDILAADTLVCLNGLILGKPANKQAALQTLQMLSGNTHKVYTGVCVMDGKSGSALVDYDETLVTFSSLESSVIDDYVSTGEPMDKAGAYGIQGRAGMFIESISGSYSNVIGLPMALTRKMLKQLPQYANL
jgi:MAF protein